MTAVDPIRVVAQVDAREHAGVRLGLELLAWSVGEARQGSQKIALAFAAPDVAASALPAAHAYVLSLLPEVSRPSDARSRLANQIRALQDRPAATFLFTVFRHVPERDRTGGPNETLAHIRTLNLMAVELSHELGVKLIDVDHLLARFGGGRLQTDYRLGGASAADLCGHATAAALLAGGLDDAIDPAVQEAARDALGPAQYVRKVIRRMMDARAGGGGRHG